MSSMTAEGPGSTDVLELLRVQRDLCRRLQSCASTQRSLITGDQPEKLLEVLGERQRLLDRLILVGDQLRPFQKSWTAVRGQLPPAQSVEADALVNEVNVLLGGILRADEADAQLLSARKSATADEIRQVGHGRQAGAAYAAATTASAGAARVDWTGE